MTIRDLPEEVHRRISERAAENGRTPEDEARSALEERFRPPNSESRGAEDWLRAIASIRQALRAANGGDLPAGVVDEFLAEKRQVAAAESARVKRYVRGSSGGRWAGAD